MPQVVNGCGTWYYGKRNITTRDDYCEFCNRLATLKSYDTTHCIVILFLPIIPLGKKHIIDECPVCRKHRAMPLKDWEQSKASAMSELLAKWRQQKSDLQAAKDVLGAAMLFQDRETFEEVASSLGQLGANDPKMMAALGGAYEHFDRLQPAEEAYRTALALEQENPIPVRNSLALNLLRQNRPDDAWPLLEEVIQKKDQTATGLLYVGAESFQSLGKHDNALYVIKEAMAAFPHLAQDRQWKKLKKQSEKHYSTGKSLKGKALTPTGSKKTREQPLLSTVGKFIMPTLLLIGVIAFFSASYNAGKHRKVYVLNGLPVEYTADIAGQPVKLPAMGMRSIEIPEGNVSVHVHEPELHIEDQSCHFESNIFSRLFASDAIVINPDRAALILWQEIEYSENPDPNDSGETKLHVGNLLNTFAHIEFPFEPFPDKMRASSGDSFKKRRIEHVNDLGETVTLSALKSQVNEQAVTDYFSRLPLREPHEEYTVGVYGALVSTNAFITQLKSMLDDRPVRTEVHRVYQEMMYLHEPDHNVAAEYRKRLDAEPNNPALMYLYARTLNGGVEANFLLERAANANPPCARAFGGLAYAQLGEAKFKEAQKNLSRALEIDPDTASLRSYELDAMLALEDYQQLLNKLVQLDDSEILPAATTLEFTVYTLTKQGRTADADALIADAADKFDDLDPELRELFFAKLRAMRHYVSGDVPGSLEQLKPFKQAPARFVIAMESDDFDAAAELLPQIDEQREMFYLLIYAHKLANGLGEADDLRDAVVAELKKGRPESRRVAEWLSTGELPDVNAALTLTQETQAKAATLAALAARFPEHREKLIALAEKLNFDYRFPHREIANVLTALHNSNP